MTTTYVFDSNTLSLYRMYGGQSMAQLLTGPYKDIIAKFHEDQKNQYNLWLSLSDDQQDDIIDKMATGNRGQALVDVVIRGGITDVSLPEIDALLKGAKIVTFKKISCEYLEFIGTGGEIYLVTGRLDPVTNQIHPL